MRATAVTSDEPVRRDKAILVVECYALGMIAVVRSLGRAGYRVHAVSSQADALGFHSTFVARHAQHPAYGSAEFIPWLDNYLAEHRIAAIIPSEGFLHAIAAHYDKYRTLLPDAVPIEVCSVCMSKVSTQLKLLELDPNCTHLPPGGVVYEHDPLPSPEQLASHRKPFYLKADVGQAKEGRGAVAMRCETIDDLRREMALLRPHYRALLWQSYAPGKKVGVSLWRHNGTYMAESMTIGVHMGPHTGGMMSLRKGFWHEQILADAKQKMAALQWDGIGMMEYKWNPETDEFWFIEINARYWGYLHLDLFCGKDFPRLQLDGYFGHRARDLGPARRKLSCRSTIPGELGYLGSLLKDRQVSKWRKLREIVLFFCLFLHPTQKADLLFPNDRGLYWLQWKRFLAGAARR